MSDVTIKVRSNGSHHGPYKVSGPAVVHDASGRTVSTGDEDTVVVLCRCGRTASAPGCDGSHRRPS